MERLKNVMLALVMLLAWSVAPAHAQEKYLGRKFYSVTDFLHAQTTTVSTAADAAYNFQHLNTGGSVLTEISTFGVAGYAMTAADVLGMLAPELPDADRTYTRAYRIAYTSSSTDSDGGINWLFSQEERSPNSALEATTVGLADDIAFDSDSATVQYGTRWTTPDSQSSSTFSTYNTSTLRQLMVELDADGDASGDEIHFLGMEEIYVKANIFDLWRESKRDSVWIPGPTIGGVAKGFMLRRDY